MSKTQGGCVAFFVLSVFDFLGGCFFSCRLRNEGALALTTDSAALAWQEILPLMCLSVA